MRPMWMALASLAFLGLAASPVSGQAEEAAGPDDDEGISVLAVLTASEGTYDAGSDGVGTLTLEGVERATWFSDRPAREVGVYTIDELNDTFFSDQVPPNAALEMLVGPDETQDVVILELSSPTWDADSGRLTYDAIVLEPGTLAPDGSALAAHHDRADAAVPAAFGTAVLFIDSADQCQWQAGPFGGFITNMVGVTCPQAKEVATILIAKGCSNYEMYDTPYGRWGCQSHQRITPFQAEDGNRMFSVQDQP